VLSEREAARELLRRRHARRNLIDFARYTFKRYQPAKVHHKIAEKLQGVAEGRIKRLMIFVPPRTGKSELASKRFPAFFLGLNPHRHIISASYSHELAQGFGRDVRNIIASDEYQALFPGITLSEDSKSAGRFHTSEGGQYLAAGVGSTMTGHGAHILLIDDPVKDREQAESHRYRDRVYNWYSSTAYTRLENDAEFISDDPLWTDPVSGVQDGKLAPFEGAVVLVMTRWHKDDLAGRLLEDAKRGGDQWEVLSIPATDDELSYSFYPEKMPVSWLRKKKMAMRAADWESLYMQRPPSMTGQYVKREYLKRGTPQKLLTLCIGFDLAISQKDTADKFAYVVAGRDITGQVFFLHAWKGRLLFHEQKARVKEMYDQMREQYGISPVLAIEDVQYQSALIQDLLHETSLPVIPAKPEGKSKIARFLPVIERYELGMITHAETLPDWFDRDVIEFPDGERDAVDAAAYAFRELPAVESMDSAGVGQREVTATNIQTSAGWGSVK